MKNIPVPLDEKYLHTNFRRSTKETYGLKTSKALPIVKELKAFQDGLYDIAKNIKFKRVRNNF